MAPAPFQRRKDQAVVQALEPCFELRVGMRDELPGLLVERQEQD
jgi:hypothetical protein